MAEQPEYVDATFYATIEPVWRHGSPYFAQDAEGRPILDGAKVTGITQKRPERKARSGSIVTKLTLRIEAAALLPLVPSAVIHVRAGDAETIEVTAEDPAFPAEEAQDG